ncbi:MAG: TetR/AcrR family transcriptional regulator [Pseudonocardiaceae bacterium]
MILESTLVMLAEHGYDGMTIDLVAAHAGMARATVYRRWPTKADLVLSAVARLSRDDVDLEHLPDTGSLRGDMVAMIRPFDEEQQQIHIQAVVGLLTLTKADERLAAAATGSGIGPWIEVNRILIQRAVDRGEFARPVDIDTLAELIPMLCVSRAAQRLPIDRVFSEALIDGVIIPALRGSSTSENPSAREKE